MCSAEALKQGRAKSCDTAFSSAVKTLKKSIEMWPNEDMHCRDWHCCTVSHQEGEISPRQEKSESNNTQQTQRRKSLEYIGSSINTISFFQAVHAGKPSVTFLNNSPSIFVITMTLLQMCGEKSVESAEGSIVENDWKGCLGGFTSRKRSLLCPPAVWR